jgi:hypothetical protein
MQADMRHLDGGCLEDSTGDNDTVELDNVEPPTSHNPTGLHSLLQGQIYFPYFFTDNVAEIPACDISVEWYHDPSVMNWKEWEGSGRLLFEIHLSGGGEDTQNSSSHV